MHGGCHSGHTECTVEVALLCGREIGNWWEQAFLQAAEAKAHRQAWEEYLVPGKTSWHLRCPLTWPHLFVPLSVIWSVPLFKFLVLYSLLTTCPKIGFLPPSRSTLTTPTLPCLSFIWPSVTLNAPSWNLGFLGAVLSLQLHGIFSESKEYFSIFLSMFYSTQLTVEPALPPGFPSPSIQPLKQKLWNAH